MYLATSDNLQGLVVQGRTVTETLEIARDIAKKLIESQNDKSDIINLPQVDNKMYYPLIIGI